MTRKTKEALLKDILDKLAQKDYTINELAKDSNWSTIRDAVYLLRGLGLIDVVEHNNSKLCSLKKTANEKNYEITSNTLFKIPITKEEDNLFSFLFSEIKQKIKETKKREPLKTEVAKIAAEVISNMKLELPIGWYLHGLIPVKLYDPDAEYKHTAPENKEQIDDEITKVIEEYGDCIYVADVVKKQYKKHNKKMYQIRQ